jgi:ketosteroid isomerase-like protein
MSAPNSSFTARSPKLSFVNQTLVSAFEEGDGLVHTKPLERALVDTIQEIYAALGRGDIDGFMAFFTDDVVVDLHVPQDFQFIRHAEGKQEARSLVLHNFGLLESQAPQIVSAVAQGDTVVVTLKEIGVVRATGTPYSIQVSQQFTFRGGKVWRFSEVAASHAGS